MALKTLAAAACLSICTATAGLATTVIATTVTVGGIEYVVYTTTGTFSDNEALLMGQVWWGDFSLAVEFTKAVGADLQTPNSFYRRSSGPYFAYTQDDSFSVDMMAWVPRLMDFDVFRHGITVDELTFAIAEPAYPVPLPAGGLLLVSAIGGIAALKRRKKGSA